ncbi:MAG: alpha/beta hydrolase [Spirochaetales bacterium]|nr:alpha/beta hydrolase [Spirochaetales bacterium]
MSNTVILYSHGGPITELDTNYFDDLGASEYHEVYVHQANTINPSIMTGLKENLSFERAKRESEVSVDILERVARYFKAQGKTVYLVGHSLGAFIIPRLLTRDASIVDKVVIAAGRLDIPQVVWQGFRDREPYRFTNGITPVRATLPEEIPADQLGTAYAGLRLQAALGYHRYTEELIGRDLSSVLYVYGLLDEAVGRLTVAEKSFLGERGARVVESAGGHGSMLDDGSPSKESIKDFLGLTAG